MKRSIVHPLCRTLAMLRLLLAILLGSWSLSAFSQPPNIVLILSDDQGWGDLHVNGNLNVHTPHIDELARTGATFDRFYVSPVCSPTRAELLTGRYHVRGGVYGTSSGKERLDLDEETIADVFKAAGYATAAYGKWHNGAQYPYHPNARGFDDFYGFCSGHWGNYFSPVLEHNGERVRGEGFIIDDLTNKALDFISAHRSSPFFLYLPYNTPHSPMQVPDRWWARYKDKDLYARQTGPPGEDTLHTKAVLAMSENIDWNVGRVLDKLRELKLEENTIVIYLSDNGPNGFRWNDGMKGKKGSTDEGGVRSPAFLRWPGKVKAGNLITQPAAAIDLLPTLTDLAGIPWQPAKVIDGKSLKPLLFEAGRPWPDRMIFSYWRGRASVRTQRFRLDAKGKLYDMKNDPGQSKPVNDQFPEAAGKLQSAFATWQEEVLSELPGEETPRPFTLGHPDAASTWLPAGEGQSHGHIERSNRYPNSSFFTNWIATEDSITWDVEVLSDGLFEVTLFYACPEADLGSLVQLSCGDVQLDFKVSEVHDPPLQGMEHDRVPRSESYIKDFKPMPVGSIRLKKGRYQLSLKAPSVTGRQVMEMNGLLFKKIE